MEYWGLFLFGFGIRLISQNGEGNGNPLQYSCLSPWMVQYSPWGHKESDTTE